MCEGPLPIHLVLKFYRFRTPNLHMPLALAENIFQQLNAERKRSVNALDNFNLTAPSHKKSKFSGETLDLSQHFIKCI